MNRMFNILIIEDEESHIELIKRGFSDYPQYKLTFVYSIADAKKCISENNINVIISDWRLPDGEGIDLVGYMKPKGFFPIILMTSFGNQEFAVEAMKLGVIDYVVKSPESFNRLPYTVGRAIREWENVVARERAEKALRESETRYRAYVETTKDAIFQVDLSGNFIFVNNAGTLAVNVEKNEIIGKNITEYFPESYIKFQMEAIEQVVKTKKPIDFLMPLPVNGSLRELDVALFPFTNKEGDIESIIGVSHDITDIKRTEKALKISEANLREQSELLYNILRHIPDYIYWKDNQSVYRGCNDNFAKSFGFDSTNKIVGKTDYDLYGNKEEAEKIISGDLSVMENGKPLLNNEEETINLSNEKIIISKNLIPLKDSEGKRAGIMGMYSDITKRKNSDAELRKLSRATEQSPALIVITDTKGNIEYVNPSFEKVTGYLSSDVKGKNSNLLKSGYTPRSVYNDLWNTLLSGNEWRGEFQNKKKNGELYWEAASISAIKNEKGKITHFIAVKEDITKRKELEFDLKHAVDQSEESSRLKSSLLSNMSHELRTPLNGILGLSQILIEEMTDTSLSSFAKKIYLAGKRLMITLNSILDLSEIESNTTQINKIEYDLGTQINYLLTQYIYAAKEKGLNFSVNILDDNITALVDERLCNQVLINLVDNAVKYTEKGKIEISIEKEIIHEVCYLKICISDTGIGISQENIPLIFEEFRQVSEGFNRSFEGSGLGLTLVKKMLLLLEGKLKVESEIGIGSKFIVYLPGKVKKSEDVSELETSSALPEIENKNNPSVLLVEDNAINKEVITCYIENFCDVDGVSDGIEAIEKAGEKQYDIVLMDINLGHGMDGIEATKEIKKISGYNDIPFVALTGYAMSGDKERLLREGLTHYLPKPFEKEDLQRLLKSVLGL